MDSKCCACEGCVLGEHWIGYLDVLQAHFLLYTCNKEIGGSEVGLMLGVFSGSDSFFQKERRVQKAFLGICLYC